MVSLTTTGPVWTLDLGEDENRFSPDWMDEVDARLDDVVGAPEAVALLTTGSGKFFSNGLDLDWLSSHQDQMGSYVARVERLFQRFLTLPVPTVAAINGHAFGAGAMLALAHDYRAMRQDRGFFCLPEVDILIPFTPGMSALVQCKVSPQTARDTMTTGRRLGGDDALAAGIVEASVGLDALPATAAGLVSGLAGKDRPTLGTIKSTMYAAASAALLAPTA
ncbi:enoyl-CoA hydratase-related protein [Nocardioides sp.]|uniref:enoyl-CoA hydratase-related protein n=1 Tax=Nocardioides sp. TaxID=35761 RepID=UPI003515E4A0